MYLPKEFITKNVSIIADGCFNVWGRNIEKIQRFKHSVFIV
jgi:hypothetical protein